MSLGDHLRELRHRVVVSLLAIVVCSAIGWWQYDWIFAKLQAPIEQIRDAKGNPLVTLNMSGVTDSLSLLISVGLTVGLVISSPVWLYQLWAFVVPGLTRKERRTTMLFLGGAVPLFLAGCTLGYFTLPKAIGALLGFTPSSAANIMPATEYLNFVLKFILAFGLAFLLPVFLVGLNAAHVLPARTMVKGWRPAVFLIFLFAAIMTPSPDPWSMLFLGLPMVALFFAAVGVSALIDRRRARSDSSVAWAAIPDDQASPL